MSAMLATQTRIRKTFNPGTPNEVRALQGVDLTLDEGSFVIVIGTNGSGKSTLLNARGRLVLRRRGHDRLDGTDITRWPEHRRATFIGRVFQNPFSGTAPTMTIAENLALAARRGQPRGLGLGAQGQRAAASCAIASPPEAGAGGSARQRDRQPVGRPAAGADAADGVVAAAAAAAARRAHRRARSEERRPGHPPERGDRRARQADDADGDALDAAGRQPRRPADHDAPRLACCTTSAAPRSSGLRPDDLLARFESVRRAEQLDESAAEMLRRTYV